MSRLDKRSNRPALDRRATFVAPLRRMSQATTLMTSAQAGAVLGKSARTVQRMAESGRLPYVQRLPGPNGSYLFDPDVVHAMQRRLAIERLKPPQRRAS
jgi:hypothetical protein